MPIRTRKKQVTETPKRVRSKTVYKDKVQQNPKNNDFSKLKEDEYYYLSFLWKNSVDDFYATVALIESKGLPFEWSKSSSGCMSFRISRENFKKHPELNMPKGKKYEMDCPAFMPYTSYGREYLWQMQERNEFPYLYKEWTPIVSTQRRRRRRA